MMKRALLPLLLAGIFCLLCFTACKPEAATEDNPYASINRNPTDTEQDTLPDPASITGIYQNILSVKCANPGCHDGHFEPDFRTIQSAYNTLVYAPVKKNNSGNTFTWRVKPNDVANSWLHERLTTDDPVLGRMPLYSTPLSAAELDHIRTWINRGAPGIDGSLPIQPNTLPVLEAFIATTLSGIRVDTIRENDVDYNPILLPADSAILFYFVVQDDQTPPASLTQNVLKISGDMNDFSAAQSFNATFLNLGQFQVWRVQLNPGSFPSGQTHYFRYYVGDGVNPGITEFPQAQSPIFLKSFASFKLTP